MADVFTERLLIFLKNRIAKGLFCTLDGKCSLKVNDAMNDFISWLQNNKEDLDPIILAAQVHYRFVTIHPFIDGNGRTARLLMNLILIQNGYPPAVIKVSNRVEYIQAIEKAQNENILDDFYMVIAKAVDESLDTYLNILNNDIELI
jgi:Fic family protein